MEKPKTSSYNLRQQSRLLKNFDGIFRRSGKVLVANFGTELADTMVQEVRREYELLIPQLPYIGGKQPFTQFLLGTAQALAMYRVCQKHNISVEECGKLFYQMTEEVLRSYPNFVLRLIGYLSFSGFYIRRLQKRATESQQRQYPGDYVFTFVPGDGKDFDYGVDYLECAGCKFLNEQGAPELAPYICPVDVIYSEVFNWGLVRTMTIAQGHDKCDFRFKKGGKTRVAVPEAIKQLL